MASKLALAVRLAFLLAVISAGRVLSSKHSPAELFKSAHESHGLDLDLAAIVTRLTEELQHVQTKVLTLEKLEARVEELEKKLAQKCKLGDIVTLGQGKTNEGDRETRKDYKNSPAPRSAVSHDAVGRLKGIRQTPQSVAFSVVVSRPLVHIQKWQIIKYDRIVLNTGGGYNATSGVFTTPTSGTYLFLYHLGHYGDGETWVELLKNGVPLNGLALKHRNM